jgi:hypothetical protein
MGEIRDLVKNPPDGIRYTENDENTVAEIHAVIDGPGEKIAATKSEKCHIWCKVD